MTHSTWDGDARRKTWRGGPLEENGRGRTRSGLGQDRGSLLMIFVGSELVGLVFIEQRLQTLLFGGADWQRRRGNGLQAEIFAGIIKRGGSSCGIGRRRGRRRGHGGAERGFFGIIPFACGSGWRGAGGRRCGSRHWCGCGCRRGCHGVRRGRGVRAGRRRVGARLGVHIKQLLGQRDARRRLGRIVLGARNESGCAQGNHTEGGQKFGECHPHFFTPNRPRKQQLLRGDGTIGATKPALARRGSSGPSSRKLRIAAP